MTESGRTDPWQAETEVGIRWLFSSVGREARMNNKNLEKRCSVCGQSSGVLLELGKRSYIHPHGQEGCIVAAHEEIERLNAILDLERLAKIEHDQWIHWSQAVFERLVKDFKTMSPAEALQKLRERWEPNWVPYSELTEEVKGFDRIWARKVRGGSG